MKERQSELEKKIRKSVKENGWNQPDDHFLDFPELNRNDVNFFIEICTRNHWEYEMMLDWDGTLSMDIFQRKLERVGTGYTYRFDDEGYLESLYSDFEYDFFRYKEHIEEEIQEVRENLKEYIDASFEDIDLTK